MVKGVKGKGKDKRKGKGKGKNKGKGKPTLPPNIDALQEKI